MASDLNIGPTGPAGAVPTSRALTRVTPVSPHAPVSPDGVPLERSGLDVRELISTADHVVVRARTPAIALDMGLEQARGLMVRNHPADALAVLDEVWSGAQHTESGWYLRASSLALLGLPAEAARVATDAIGKNPRSNANLFVLSLAKLTLGELQVARQSIAEAMRNGKPDALLLVQSALLEAQAGQVSDAEQLLKRASAEWPDHPALTYGKRMIREVLHTTRDAKFPLTTENGDFARVRTPAFSRTPVSSATVHEPDFSDAAIAFDSIPMDIGAGTSADTVLSNGVRRATAPGSQPFSNTMPDAVGDAIRTLGAAVRNASEYEAIVIAREMLASLSSGGALANATIPARAHVLRSLLTTVLATLKAPGKSGSVGWAAEGANGQWHRASTDATPPLESRDHLDAHTLLAETVRQAVSAMREGRGADAHAQLRRAHGSLDNTAIALLQTLVGDDELESGTARRSGTMSQSDDNPRVFATDSEPSLLTPIRLGLALLPETDGLNHALRAPAFDGRDASYAAIMHTVSPAETRERETVNIAAGLLVAAAGVFALGVLALAFGRPLLGLALAGAGGWLAFRSFSPAGAEPR